MVADEALSLPSLLLRPVHMHGSHANVYTVKLQPRLIPTFFKYDCQVLMSAFCNLVHVGEAIYLLKGNSALTSNRCVCAAAQTISGVYFRMEGDFGHGSFLVLWNTRFLTQNPSS